MGFLKNLANSKKDVQVGEFRVESPEDIRRRMYADQPEALAGFEEPAKEPGPLSKGWSLLGRGVTAPFRGISKLGRSVKSYTQKATKTLISQDVGMIDPKLYKNLVERGKFDDIKGLREQGLSVPELVAEPIAKRLPEERKELYTGNLIKDLMDAGQTEESIRQSVFENRFNDMLQENYPDLESLSRNNQEAIYDKLINEMTLSPKGEMTADELIEIATYGQPKRSEIYGEMPGYIFVTNAVRDFTSGWVDFSLQPETTKERVFGVLGDVTGIVASLAVTGKALQGAVNYLGGTTNAIKAAKAIKDVKIAATALKAAKKTSFFVKYPKLAPLLREIGAFNIHGQLNPELEDDMSARLRQATMDTAMAVGMWSMNTTFAKLGALGRAGKVRPIWQYGGMPATAAVFGTLSAMNGDSMEEIVTNALVGGALGGMGLLNRSGYYAITSGEARSKLTKASKLKLNKNYTNIRVEKLEQVALERLETKYKEKGIFDKKPKLSDRDLNILREEYGTEMTKLNNMREVLIKTPVDQRSFQNPVSVFKEIKNDIKAELNMMIGRKGKVEDIKTRPAKLEEQSVPTRPEEPIITKDGKGIVIGDIVFEVGKDSVNDIMTNGKAGFESRIKLLNKELAITKDIKLREKLVERINRIEGVAYKMGFIGERITDIKPERPTVAITIPKTLGKVKGLTPFSVEKIVESLVSKIKGVKVPTEKSAIIENAIKEAFPKATPKEVIRLKRVIGKALAKSADVEGLPQVIKEAIEAEKKVKPKVKAVKEIPERVKITAKEQREVATEIKTDEAEIRRTYKETGKKAKEAFYEVYTLLDLAKPGKRAVVKPRAEEIFGVEDMRMDERSTFPEWIPSELRNKKLINQIINQVFDVKNVKFPSNRGSRARELYNTILNEIDLRVKVNTTPMRERILQNYDKIYKGKFAEEKIGVKEKAPKPVREGIEGREKVPEKVKPKAVELEIRKSVDGSYSIVNKTTGKKISSDYSTEKSAKAFELGFKTARNRTSIEKPLKIRSEKGIFKVIGEGDVILSRSMKAETAGAYIEGHQKGVLSLKLDKLVGVEAKMPKGLESVTNQARKLGMNKFVDEVKVSPRELADVIKNNKDNKIPVTKTGDEYVIGQLEDFWRIANGKEKPLAAEVPAFGDMAEIARLKREAKRPRFGEVFEKPKKKEPVVPVTLRKQKGFYLPPLEFTETNLFKQIEGKPIGVEESLMIERGKKIPKKYNGITDAFIKEHPGLTKGFDKEEVYRYFIKPTVDRIKVIEKRKAKDPEVLASEVAGARTLNEMTDIVINEGITEIKPPKVSKKNLNDRESIDEYKEDKISDEIPVAKRSSLSETGSKYWRKLMDSMVDKYDAITRVQDLFVKAGANITPDKNPVYAIKKMFGIKSVSDIELDYFTFALTPGTRPGWIRTGKGLAEIIRPLKPMMGDIKVLLFAQRDIELSGRKGKRAIKGTDVERSQDVIKKLGKVYGEKGFKELEKGAQEIRDWARRALFDPLYTNGVISREVYKKILESNKLYIPFFRIMDNLEKGKAIKKDTNLFSSKSVPLKRIFGSDKKIIDPIESLIGNLYALNAWLAKERVKKNLVNLRKYDKEIAKNEIVEIDRPKMAKVAVIEKTAEIDAYFIDTLKDYTKKLGGTFTTKGKAGKTLGMFYPKLKAIVRKFATSPKTAAHEFAHLVDSVFLVSERFHKLTPIGKEIYNFSKDRVEETKNRLKNPKERFANAFSWWLTQRELASKDIPLFSKEMSKIIKNTPELKGLSEVKQSPKSAIERTMEDVFRPSMFQDPDVIEVHINGKRRYFRVSEDLAKAVRLLDVESSSRLLNIMGIPARFLRAGATLSPDFMLRNPLRDQFQAAVHSKYGYVPFIDLGAGIYNMLMNTKSYKEFKMSGAEHSMLVSIDRLANRRTYDKLMDQSIKKLGKEYMKHPLDALRVLSEIGEKGTRLGEFRKARKAGATLEEAGFAARDVTIDFKRMGTIGGELNKIIAFWNANVQDIDKIRRSWKERPIRSTMNALIGLTLPSIGFFMVNKDDEMYWELPRWRRDLFWNIPVHAGGVEFISIPKPFLLGATWATSVERALEFVYRDDPKALTTFPGYVATTMSPGVFPTAFLPAFEHYANYSFFRKRPIVSESIQDLPPELQSASYTTETAKKIGNLLKISPAKLENTFYGYTAGLGRYGLQLSDFLMQKVGIISISEKPTKTLGDIPLVRAFVPREPTGSGSESVNKFYELLTEARQTDEAIDLFVKSGEFDKAEKYRKDNPDFVYLKGLEKVARDFSELRKRINAAYVSDTLNADEKRETIDALNKVMTEMANQIIVLIKESQ